MGAGSYRVLSEDWRRPQDGPVPEFSIVGFPLGATLSPDGPVSAASAPWTRVAFSSRSARC